jgi:hypothetical protein
MLYKKMDTLTNGLSQFNTEMYHLYLSYAVYTITYIYTIYCIYTLSGIYSIYCICSVYCIYTIFCVYPLCLTSLARPVGADFVAILRVSALLGLFGKTMVSIFCRYFACIRSVGPPW